MKATLKTDSIQCSGECNGCADSMNIVVGVILIYLNCLKFKSYLIFLYASQLSGLIEASYFLISLAIADIVIITLGNDLDFKAFTITDRNINSVRVITFLYACSYKSPPRSLILCYIS